MHGIRRARVSLAAFAATALIIGIGASPAVAKPPKCTVLTLPQISRSLGSRVVSLSSPETAEAGGPALTCFWTTASNAGVSLDLYRGSRAFAEQKSSIDEGIGSGNATQDAADPGGCTAAWGQCMGGTYNGHESPLDGLGEKALAFPGSASEDSLVMFVSDDFTFTLGSDGPYTDHGPGERQLISFARLLIRTHFSRGS
jgi:hypothetical protein